MAISADAAALLIGASPHSFHGGHTDLLKGPSSLLKCPFMRAFLSLKATCRSSPLPVSATSAKLSPDLHKYASQNQENHVSDALVEPAHEISRVLFEGNLSASLPLDADSIQARYATRKSSIVVLGLSVHSAPVQMREKLAVPEANWVHAVEELCAYPHIEEAGVLSTCNRLEVYVSALSWHMGIVEVLDWMSQKSGISLALLREHVFVLQNQDASRHLFRVASGLDSLVLGEGQILSQVKQVMQIGQAVKGFGRQLTGLFKQALVSGKRVRSETSIGAGAVSVSSAAVELLAKKTSLKDAHICIVGAGKMAALLVKHLMSKGCTDMLIVNRSEGRVQELQRQVPDATLTFQPLQKLSGCIREAEVVFTCTASDIPLIDKSIVDGLPCVMGRRHFVDISVPRNVCESVQELGCAAVYNVDDLEEVVAGNKEERAKKAMEAEAIIEEELNSFTVWQDSLETVPTIKKLRAYAERIRVGELEKYLDKMGDGLTLKEKKAADELSRGIVNKMLHGPMVHLRNDGRKRSCRVEIVKNAHALERMFDLNAEMVPVGMKLNGEADAVR